MAEPRDPREPRIPKESPPFDADNKWTRVWIMYFESLFTLSVKEAVRQAGTVTHTAGDLTKDLPVFGNDKADIKVGTKSGNTTEVATVAGAVVTGNTVKWDANHNLIDAGVTPGGGGGGGTGTVTNTGGALTADQPVFGAGSADIKVGTKTGNTNKVVTNTGTNVTGNTVKWDASGNLIDAGSAPGGGSGTVTSVALTVPSEFSVSGSPVTTSGTLAVSKATQTANIVYAGPTTGSAAAPTFRAVVPADLPLASSSAFGAVKVDGTTISASSGVISMASPVIIAAGPTTQTDATASRAIGSTYQNTSNKPLYVSVWGNSTSSTPGSFWAVCDSGASPSLIVAATGYTANSVNIFVAFVVPPNYYYGARKDQSLSLSKWIEWTDGSTSTPLTLVKGDLITYDTQATKLPVGSDGQVLLADSAQAKGIKWGAAGSGAVSTQTDYSSSGRALGTVYQNTGSKPLFVSAVTYSSAAAYTQVFADASNPPTTIVNGMGQSTTCASCIMGVFGIVLPGNYYKIVVTGGTPGLSRWIEWS